MHMHVSKTHAENGDPILDEDALALCNTNECSKTISGKHLIHAKAFRQQGRMAGKHFSTGQR